MATKKHATVDPEKLEFYKMLVATNPKTKLKGDKIPYTSHNGHMFSNFNPDGTLGLRLPLSEIEGFIAKYKTGLVHVHGIVRKEYVVVPDTLLANTKELKPYYDKSFAYVCSLKPGLISKSKK